ncbi:hypothetical protein EDD85DRAFT_959890 [Armillaria nabsnona]|nr:hypothetical protein EDD85DRAFT_959890 [Armillaria nabsnona]
MNMNLHHIKDDEMLISKQIYHLVNTDTIGVARVIEILCGMTGSSIEDLDILYIGGTLENHAARGYGPLKATLPRHLTEHLAVLTRETVCDVLPSDLAVFDTWIVALFLRKVDTSHQHPEWLYACKQAPRHIPCTDPAAFNAWITSFTHSKANRTHHRDTVCDEPHNRIFIDTLSGGGSGSVTAMSCPLYPEPGLPWWIVPPRPPLLFHIPKPVDEPPGSVRSEFADLSIHHPISSKQRHYNPHTLHNTANTR